MEWSEPVFAFRVSFKKVNYINEKLISDKETHYERLQTNANDYERLRTIMNDWTKTKK